MRHVISVDAIVSLISPSANPPMLIDNDSERLKAFLRHESRSASYIERRREALTGGIAQSFLLQSEYRSIFPSRGNKQGPCGLIYRSLTFLSLFLSFCYGCHLATIKCFISREGGSLGNSRLRPERERRGDSSMVDWRWTASGYITSSALGAAL